MLGGRMRRVTALVIVLSAVLARPPVAGAQTTTAPLARFITDLLAAGAIIDSSVTNPKTAATERRDFLVATQLAGMPALLNQAIDLQMTTFPVDLGLDASRPGFESVPA